ncbi:MAG: pilus assembly protein [Caldilinea sp. CFX5]|nr:pilus assembly protein [Caldilinea sp. CFX5]
MKQRSLLTPLLHTISRRQEGISLAEFALVLPVFLLILLGMVDMGRGFNTYIGMLNATREGAMWLASAGDDLAGMNARIESELSHVGLSAGNMMITRIPNKSAYEEGDLVTLKIAYPYDLLFGAITGFSTVTIRTEHTVRVQNP